MVTGLKEQLDGLLIFAGLFAGVNSAFLALTLPLMSPDPADDTNALLRDNNAILLNIMMGRNDTLLSTNALPSETFSPSGQILTVNVLFSVSLTFALVTSFLAVLGRQWLVYYRKRTGGGPERQRWEQLKRFLGAERWQLEWVLDDFLPSLLQIGLIIFCVSITIYLNTLHPTLSNVVGIFMCAGLAILIITAIFAFWDKFCPFQSPLSHALSHVIPPIGRAVGLSIILLLRTILWPFGYIAVALNIYRSYGPRSVEWPWDAITVHQVKVLLDKYCIAPITSLHGYVKRKEEGNGTLQITAIRRAICTSDDARTQAHAVSNILGITNTDLLARLAADEEFNARISELCSSSYNRALQLCGSDRTDLAAATSWLYRAAVTHIFLSTVSPSEQLTDKQWGHLLWGRLDTPSLSLSSDLMQNASPNMTIASLGFMALFTNTDPIQTRAYRLALRSTISGLVDPSWKCISMITEVIMVYWRIHGVNKHREYRGLSRQLIEQYWPASIGRDVGKAVEEAVGHVHSAWVGEPLTVHQNLKLLLERSNDPQCRDRDILREYLVDIFKLAGKTTAASGGDSSGGQSMAAGFLLFSEGLLRDQNSPSNLINAGRKLRAQLINGIRLEFENHNGENGNYTSPETVGDLRQLFNGLTARLKSPSFDLNFPWAQIHEVLRRRSPYRVTVGWQAITTSNEDDELVYSFNPILRDLNAALAAKRRDLGSLFGLDTKRYMWGRNIDELSAAFAGFKTAVESVSRAIKRRKRDPDLGWCYYEE